MITNLEHIGIAVENLEEAENLFSKLFNRQPYKREVVESEGVITSFFDLGNVKIELLASISPGSAIDTFISRRGAGLHHLAFETSDINSELQQAVESGFQLIHAQPKDGADNKTVAFLHPKSTAGVLTEFCQEKAK